MGKINTGNNINKKDNTNGGERNEADIFVDQTESCGPSGFAGTVMEMVMSGFHTCFSGPVETGNGGGALSF